MIHIEHQTPSHVIIVCAWWLRLATVAAIRPTVCIPIDPRAQVFVPPLWYQLAVVRIRHQLRVRLGFGVTRLAARRDIQPHSTGDMGWPHVCRNTA